MRFRGGGGPVPAIDALRNLINAPIPPIPRYPNIVPPDTQRRMDKQLEIQELMEEPQEISGISLGPNL